MWFVSDGSVVVLALVLARTTQEREENRGRPVDVAEADALRSRS